MKVYTSYFANSAKLREKGIMQIGIALWKPRYFTNPSVYSVAPKRFMLQEDLTREQYIECYKKYVLEKLDVGQFLKTLESLSEGRDVALCCYEKPNEFCHRHLLADFLKEKAGIEIEEFGYTKKKDIPDCQLNLAFE